MYAWWFLFYRAEGATWAANILTGISFLISKTAS
jgi:hypothetical protein